MFFHPDFLRSLRDINRDSLTSRATVQRGSTASTPGGGTNTGRRTWTTIADGDDVPCRVATPGMGSVIVEAGQLAALERFAVVFDLTGPAIAENDRLTITGTDVAGVAWSRTALVISAQTPRTYSAMRVFVCQVVSPGMA